MSKATLDHLLKKHKAQPVGKGYIDIIVSREHYKPFVYEIIENGYEIEVISRWEWCKKDNSSKHGYGGPRSHYYDGHFSELADYDDIISADKTPQEVISLILKMIASKTIYYHPDLRFEFQASNWLTPAFWLNVSEDWTNDTF